MLIEYTVCTYVFMYEFMYVHVCVHMYACMYAVCDVFMSLCMNVLVTAWSLLGHWRFRGNHTYSAQIAFFMPTCLGVSQSRTHLEISSYCTVHELRFY